MKIHIYMDIGRIYISGYRKYIGDEVYRKKWIRVSRMVGDGLQGQWPSTSVIVQLVWGTGWGLY